LITNAELSLAFARALAANPRFAEKHQPMVLPGYREP
jgi:hypothetical protein